MTKNTICLWYEHDAENAARFYAKTFPGSSLGAVHRAPSDYPGGKAGNALMVEFTVAGIPLYREGGHRGSSADTEVVRSGSQKPL